MKLPELAIRNRRFTQVVVVMLAALGLVSFFTMPRTEDPVFDVPFAAVVVAFPGADPAVIEALAVDPIEDEIKEIEDVKVLESAISDGVAVISAEMLPGTDPDDAYDAVLQKVNAILSELPDEIRSVEVLKPSLTDVAILQIALTGPKGADEVRAAAEWLEAEIGRAGGVKRVDTWGLADPQVRVNLDAERMRALGLSIDRVAAGIQAAGADIPGGYVVAGSQRFNVRTSGDFDSVEEIARVIVPGPPGALVRVSDVADVVWATEDEEHHTRFQGREAVFLSVVQRADANIFAVLDGVRPILDSAARSLPAGVEIATVFDQSVGVSERVNGFFSSLFQGVLLVGVVMFLFVGFRPALIVILSIPLSITFAIGGVDLTGFGLQQMSIVGLVIALGLLVDDAIVVVENVGRLVRSGMKPLQAAIEGTSEVAWPSASGTVTTVLAFVPMVAISSATGDYVRSLPVTVIYALVASLILSLTLVPLLASRLLKGRTAETKSARRIGWRDGLLQRPLQRLVSGPYRRLITHAVRRPGRVVLAGAVSLGVAFALFPIVGVSLFPKAEKPQFLINIEAPEGTSLDATDEVVAFVEEALAQREEVVRYAANVGADNPQVYYNISSRQAGSNIGQLLVELDAYESADRAVADLMSVFQRYPGVRITITEFENGPPVEAPIVFKVTGPELRTLEALASRIETALVAQPGTRDVRNPLSVSRSDLALSIDTDRLALLGLDPLSVDRSVRASLAGLEVGTYRNAEGKESDIVLRFPFAERDADPTDLDRVTLYASSGGVVPLGQVARVEFAAGSGRIDHFDTERVATVTAFPVGDASVLEITRAVSDQLNAMEWPAGYDWFAGGTFEEQQEGFAGMIRALLVAVLGIFAVLVLQFRSFVQPMIIFASVPLSFVGAVLALLLTGNTFSFTAFIGITSLVGIVINNSIILVDYANRRIAAGDEVSEALRRAGETRFQPIVLTTVTTVSGLLPLTLTGSSMWSPLGWTIIGGLLTSTLLTLVLVPALYQLAARVAVPSEAADWLPVPA